MKIIAMGRTDILYDSIVKLASSGHKLVAIITSEAEQYQYTKSISDFKQLAKDLNCEFIQTENINNPIILKLIKDKEPDVGISVNWKKIIPGDFINLFDYGILNAHAGDLPKYRGNAVRNWAIISGEEKMALTIHMMDSNLDSGKILMKEYHPIDSQTTIGHLYKFVGERAPILFDKVLDNLSKDKIKPITQEDSNLLRCYPRLPVDSQISWNQTAEEIDKIVRASSEPFNGAYTYLSGEKLIIWESEVISEDYDYHASPGQVLDRSKDGVLVATGKDFLLIKDAESLGKGRLLASKLIPSIRIRLGMDYASEIMQLRKKLEDINSKMDMILEK